MRIIEFRNVTVTYFNKNVFNNVNIKINKGSFHYIVGKSGAGKTTLLRLLYSSNVPYKGDVFFLDRNLNTISQNEHQRLKQRMGVAFQSFYLLDHLNALENVTLPLRLNNVSEDQSKKRGIELLEFIGLESCIKSLPHQLSGGQKQRLVVARALIGKPDLLLADEPTGNLDDENAVLLMKLFEAINQQGITVLLATHNKDIISNFPHNKIIINKNTADLALPLSQN